MDPERCWQEALVFAARIRRDGEGAGHIDTSDAVELAERVLNLQSWLGLRGFPPEALRFPEPSGPGRGR